MLDRAVGLVDATDLAIVTFEQHARWHKRSPAATNWIASLDVAKSKLVGDVSSHTSANQLPHETRGLPPQTVCNAAPHQIARLDQNDT
jgi:hypothetical protein